MQPGRTRKDVSITYRADTKESFATRLRKSLPGVIVFCLGLVIIAGLLVFAVGWRWAFAGMPSLPPTNEALWEVRRDPAVTILDREGDILTVRGPLYAHAVSLEELPAYVPGAFLAIEDQRFYEHDGVDRRAVLRAALANAQAGGVVQGGSTLTMQLIKNLVLSPDQTMKRKLQEMRLAMRLERRLSKDEILELYLNRVYLGEQAYGVEAASRRYFDKPAEDLTLSEAALLAALPKAPSRLAPTDNLDAAQARADEVLASMLEAGFIDAEAYLQAVSNPVQPIAKPEDGPDPSVFGHVYNAAIQEAEARLGPDAQAPDLVIYTTIDRALQKEAYEAVTTALAEKGAERQVEEAALVALDLDGAVRAMIGGEDYLQSQFNRATQARRQPGSAFKPVVFTAAFEAGYEPSSTFEDAPLEIEDWSPKNFGGDYRGRITLEDALKRSINTVAARAGQVLGGEPIVEMARRLGIEAELADHPSIALGTEEVSLIGLTSIYTVFANDGYRREPYLVSEVRTTRGQLLYQRRPAEEAGRVISQSHARSMSTMLQAVVRDGTGRRAALQGRASAGKTGTSQNSRDAWFIGYTGHFATGVWVGNDDDTPTEDVTGGELPAEIWHDFMSAAHEGLDDQPLAAPAPRRRTAREERLAAFYSDLSDKFDEAAGGR